MYCPVVHPRRARRRTGFTLVEVLVTLMLMVIVLPVIFQGMSLATRAGSLARRKTEAAQLAQSKLGELIATGDWQTGSGLGGPIGPEWPDYQWAATTNAWTNGGSNDLTQLTVTITWDAAGGQQSVAFSTLVRSTGSTSSSSTSSSGTSTGSSTTGGGK